MTSTNYEENHENDLRIMNYVSKSLESKVVKDVLASIYDILDQKTTALKQEYKELENANYSVWNVEDKFCNDVWNFSLEHTFDSFFNQYLNGVKTIIPHNCKYDSAKINHVDNIEKIDVHTENIISQLRDEINTITNGIIDVRTKNIDQDLKNAMIVLNNLRSLSDEISELIRLVNIQENSINISNVPMYQHVNGSGAVGFTNAKKLFKKSNLHNCLLIEKKTISNAKIETAKDGYSIRNNIRLGKFVMKKQSLISLKFEENLKKAA